MGRVVFILVPDASSVQMDDPFCEVKAESHAGVSLGIWRRQLGFVEQRFWSVMKKCQTAVEYTDSVMVAQSDKIVPYRATLGAMPDCILEQIPERRLQPDPVAGDFGDRLCQVGRDEVVDLHPLLLDVHVELAQDRGDDIR